MDTISDIPPMKLKNFLLYELGFINNFFARSTGEFDKIIPLTDEGNSYIYQLKKREREADLNRQFAVNQIKNHLREDAQDGGINPEPNHTSENAKDEIKEKQKEVHLNPHENIPIPKAVQPVKRNKVVEKVSLEPPQPEIQVPIDAVSSSNGTLIKLPNTGEEVQSTVQKALRKRKLETAKVEEGSPPKQKPLADEPEKKKQKTEGDGMKVVKKKTNEIEEEATKILKKKIKDVRPEPPTKKKHTDLKENAPEQETVSEDQHTYSEVAQLRKKIALTPKAYTGSLLNPEERSKTLEEVCLDVVSGNTSKQNAAKLEQQHRNYLLSIALEGPSTVKQKAFISHDEIKLLLTEDAGLKARATKIMAQILKRVQTQSEAVHHLTQMNKNIKAGKYSYLTRKQEKILKGKIDKLLNEYYKSKDKQGKQNQRNRFLTKACGSALQQAKRVSMLEQTGQHHEAARQLSCGNSRHSQQKNSHQKIDSRRTKQQVYGMRKLPKKLKK